MSETGAAAGAAQAIVGFLPDDIAKALQSGRGFAEEELRVPLDPEQSDLSLRVRSADIEEVRLGPSRAGHTGVQFVLKSDAEFEIVGKARLGSDLLTPFRDPGLASVLARLQWFAIYVGPIYRQDERGQFRVLNQ